MAVGATYTRIMQLLLRQGLSPEWIGLGTGALFSVAIIRWLPVIAPFTTTYDAWAVGGLVPLLFVITLIAAFLPARRAATVNPVVALRDE